VPRLNTFHECCDASEPTPHASKLFPQSPATKRNARPCWSTFEL
jgi:hypothetical protein